MSAVLLLQCGVRRQAPAGGGSSGT